MYNTLISGNTATFEGGGIYNGNGTLSIYNMLITGNTATINGGGIYNTGTSTLTNITVAGNKADIGGGGVYSGSNTTNIRNSIIWGNTDMTGTTASNVYGTPVYSYTLLQGGAVGGGIISVDDPKFVDASAGNYRLQFDSPAIDTGDNSYNPVLTDLDGTLRIQGTIIDLGPYESIAMITAFNDVAQTTVAIPVTVKVLANDDLGSCVGSALSSFNVASGGAPQRGSVSFASDTLIYTPTEGLFGIDSLQYEFQCGVASASAWVYILTLSPLLKPYYACPGVPVTMGFEEIAGVSYDWFNEYEVLVKSSSDTIRRVKDNAVAPQTFYAKPSWNSHEFPLDTVKLYASPDVKPSVTDIRVTLCPTSVDQVYLTGYLDSLSYASAVQWTTTDVYPTIHDASSGELHAWEFPPIGTFTYSYTRFSECATKKATGKAYVHVPNGKLPPRPDTVEICHDQAATINISAIFGFALHGEWKYDDNVNPTSLVSDNTSTDPLGAVIFSGQKAYQQATPDYNIIYRGVPGKRFSFEYSYSDCATGTKRITIVIRE
jgi:hypothetical protein